MAYKNNVSVRICGKTMVLSGNESVEYITKVANYIEQKAEDLRRSDNSRSLNANLISVLTSINIADDLFKERDRVAALTKELEALKAGGMPETGELAIEIQGADDLPEDEKAILEGEVARLMKELEDALINNGSLSEELALLKEERDSLIQEKESLTREKEVLAGEKEALAQKVTALEADLREQTAKINHMKSSYGNKKNFAHNKGFKQQNRPYENNTADSNISIPAGEGVTANTSMPVSSVLETVTESEKRADTENVSGISEQSHETADSQNEPIEVQEVIRTEPASKSSSPIKNYYRNT